MMDALIEQVLAEVTACVNQVLIESLTQARALIADSDRIFVAGAGRSGLCMRALGMRLMHLGKTVFVVGDTITPSIATTDLLILGSGSGQTPSLLAIAKKAHGLGTEILLFTTDAASPLARLADQKVIIPAQSYLNGSSLLSGQPLGSLFEQSLFILCDTLILGLMPRLNVDAAQMLDRHANLE